MTRLLIITSLLLIFGLNCFGQTITGIVTDQKGDTLLLVGVILLDNGQKMLTTISDIDGQFVFKQEMNFKNKRLYAKYGSCSSDTITLRQGKTTNLKLTVNIKDSCAPKIEIPDCPLNRNMKGLYYVSLSPDNYSNIKTGDEIVKKESYTQKIETSDTLKNISIHCIPSPDNLDGQNVFLFVDSMPEFPDGTTMMMKFIRNNLNFPIQQDEWAGIIYLTFVIDLTGQIRNACILKPHLKDELTPNEKEVLRVVNLMPKWTPGRKDGKMVYVRMNLPVRIELK